MKKIILVILIVSLFGFNGYAVEFAIFDLRNKIFAESKEIKSGISTSANPILISSIWDTCTLVISEIDAYFSMLAIFDSIEKKAQTRAAAAHLIDWLKGMKQTNQLNVRNINSIDPTTVSAQEKIHMERLKDLFIQLDETIGDEIAKVTVVRKSLRR